MNNVLETYLNYTSALQLLNITVFKHFITVKLQVLFSFDSFAIKVM